MPLDPTKHADWQIAEAAEVNMKTVYQLGEELGLEKQELLPHGHYVAKLDFKNILAGFPAGGRQSISMLRLLRLHPSAKENLQRPWD